MRHRPGSISKAASLLGAVALASALTACGSSASSSSAHAAGTAAAKPTASTSPPSTAPARKLACPSAATVSTVMGSPFVLDTSDKPVPGVCSFNPGSESASGELQPGSAQVSVAVDESGDGADQYANNTSPSAQWIATPITGLGKRAAAMVSASDQDTAVYVLTTTGAELSADILRVGAPLPSDITLAENLIRTMIA
jgi:hypothetical protein